MGSSSDSTAPESNNAPLRMGLCSQRAKRAVRRPRAALSAAATVVAMMLGVLAVPMPGASAVVVSEADLRISGTVEEAPQNGGIDTNSTMRYRVTIRNDGPTDIPARGLLLVLFADRSNSSELATIEVVRFNDGGGLRPAAGGVCGNGRRTQVQCTNQRVLTVGEEIRVEIGHRHPVPEAGTLSFVAEVSAGPGGIGDPVPGNNSFRGPNYQFRDQPSTTTTSSTTTTMSTTTTEVTTTSMGDSTTTTDPNASSTTVESTTSSSSSTTTTTMPTTTTTTAPTTTTTEPTTTTTTEPTTSSSETSLAALSGSATLPSGPTTLLTGTEPLAGDQQVLGESGQAPSDGPPYLLLIGLFALVLLIGGLAMAIYANLNKPPPLVDIRRLD